MAELSAVELNGGKMIAAATTADRCCSLKQQAVCCEPSEKSECCGREERCGCTAGNVVATSDPTVELTD
jgi:hypothetical protein